MHLEARVCLEALLPAAKGMGCSRNNHASVVTKMRVELATAHQPHRFAWMLLWRVGGAGTDTLLEHTPGTLSWDTALGHDPQTPPQAALGQRPGDNACFSLAPARTELLEHCTNFSVHRPQHAAGACSPKGVGQVV